MKPKVRRFLLAVALLGAGAAVAAGYGNNPSTPDGEVWTLAAVFGPMRASHGGWGRAHSSERGGWCERAAPAGDWLGFVKDHLAIGAAQTEAWSGFEAAIAAAERRFARACQAFAKAHGAGADPAVLDAAEDALAAATAGVRELKPAYRALHAALDAEQKAKLGRLLAMRHRR